MSLETWKAEYYPKDARDTTEGEALDHSIKKWEGLRKKDADKHGIHLHPKWIGDGDWRTLNIDEGTCSLCYHHYKAGSISSCDDCPIVKATGDKCYAQFKRYVYHLDPKPMLRLLRKVKKLT